MNIPAENCPCKEKYFDDAEITCKSCSYQC